MYVKSDGTKVVVAISDGKGYEWRFIHEVGSSATANIVAEFFQDKLYKEQEKERKEYYNYGYRDGRAKRGRTFPK
jgi:hypothetical protein